MTRYTLLLFIFIVSAVSAGGEQMMILGFVGDIMVHESQLRRAWLGENASGKDRGYDFRPSFEWFTPYLAEPDLMVGNLETTFGGPDSAWITDDRYAFREYQAYPTFTTPDELATALAQAGFDVLGTANNHSMDSNLEGAARTIDVVEKTGLKVTGTSRQGERPSPWRGRVGGFDLSIIAWTASVNGLVSSRGMKTINVFNPRGGNGRLNEMLADIRREAQRNPDLLILCIHWGQQYVNEPDQFQKNLAGLAIEAGADIIIGSHPHVFQPVERRLVKTPDGTKEVFIAWSMGNFLSSQGYLEGVREWTDGSAMLKLEIVRSRDGQARVRAVEAVPIYVHWTAEKIRVMGINDGLGDDGVERFGLTEYDLNRLKALDAWIPEQFTRYLESLPAGRTEAGWRVSFPEPYR